MFRFRRAAWITLCVSLTSAPVATLAAGAGEDAVDSPTVRLRGEHAAIRRGKVAVADLRRALEALGEARPAGDAPDAVVHMATRVRRASADVVRTILEVNGWRAPRDGPLERTFPGSTAPPYTAVFEVESGTGADLAAALRPQGAAAARVAGVGDTRRIVVAGALDVLNAISRIIRQGRRSARPLQFLEVRQVDVEKLSQSLASILALWGVEVVDDVTLPDGAHWASILPFAPARKLSVQTSGEELTAEIRKLVLILDRDPDVLRLKLEPGAESGAPASVTQTRPRGDAFKGKRVAILDGEVPVAEFFRFLADYTGLPVIVEGDAHAKGTVTIAAPVHDADDTIVQAILEANGWLLDRKELAGGKEILRIRHLSSQPLPIPEARKIIHVNND